MSTSVAAFAHGTASPGEAQAVCGRRLAIGPMRNAMETSSRAADQGPIEILGPDVRTPEAVWRRLSKGENAPWLDDIGQLRTDHDDLDRSLDIWSVALIAALSDPERRETAARIVARLRKLSDEIETQRG